MEPIEHHNIDTNEIDNWDPSSLVSLKSDIPLPKELLEDDGSEKE